jgi:hypothetical protein
MLPIQRKMNLFHTLTTRLFEIHVRVSGFDLNLPDYSITRILFFSVCAQCLAMFLLLIKNKKHTEFRRGDL